MPWSLPSLATAEKETVEGKGDDIWGKGRIYPQLPQIRAVHWEATGIVTAVLDQGLGELQGGKHSLISSGICFSDSSCLVKIRQNRQKKYRLQRNPVNQHESS